jgi:hypothetical protein
MVERRARAFLDMRRQPHLSKLAIRHVNKLKETGQVPEIDEKALLFPALVLQQEQKSPG